MGPTFTRINKAPLNTRPTPVTLTGRKGFNPLYLFWENIILRISLVIYLGVGFPIRLVVEGNDNVSIPRTNTVKCNFDFMVHVLNELQETISLTIPEIKFFIN